MLVAPTSVPQSLPWNVQSGNASFASATVFFTSLSCQKLIISVVLLSKMILSLHAHVRIIMTAGTLVTRLPNPVTQHETSHLPSPISQTLQHKTSRVPNPGHEVRNQQRSKACPVQKAVTSTGCCTCHSPFLDPGFGLQSDLQLLPCVFSGPEEVLCDRTPLHLQANHQALSSHQGRTCGMSLEYMMGVLQAVEQMQSAPDVTALTGQTGRLRAEEGVITLSKS